MVILFGNGALLDKVTFFYENDSFVKVMGVLLWQCAFCCGNERFVAAKDVYLFLIAERLFVVAMDILL